LHPNLKITQKWTLRGRPAVNLAMGATGQARKEENGENKNQKKGGWATGAHEKGKHSSKAGSLPMGGTGSPFPG